MSNQVQYSVLDHRAEQDLLKQAETHGISLLCYGVVAGGFLSDRYLDKPDPEGPLENRSLTKYRLIIDEFGSWELFQDLLKTLKQVGDKYNVSLSSVAARWVLDQPQVAATIVGARYARHLPQTLQVFDFALDDEDRAAIAAIHARANGPNGPVFGLEGDRASRHGQIMKYNLNTRPDDQVLGAKGG